MVLRNSTLEGFTYGRVFADVIVYIFPHQHTASLIEAVVVYVNVMQKLKDLINDVK